jgi:hypothetical protein
MSNSKLKILYIASNGRSGSTVLEMLLNVSPHMWTLGEFHVLPWEIRQNVKPCGCGVSIEECNFWGPIIAEHRDTLLHGCIDRFRKSYKTDRALRWRELPRLFRGDLCTKKQKMEEVLRYGEDNRIVLSAVKRQAVQEGRSDVAWLVDASKSPYRLLWLAASGRFDIRVIHLVKDPRAFAYSVAKEAGGFGLTYRVARAVVRWQAENRLFELLYRNYLSTDHVFRLRYEQLAGSPDATLRELASWLAVPVWSGAKESFRDKNHGISGNPSRFKSDGIKLDEKWRSELSGLLQLLAYKLGIGLTARYGYELGVATSQSITH